jgi:hypothetical protein
MRSGFTIRYMWNEDAKAFAPSLVSLISSIVGGARLCMEASCDCREPAEIPSITPPQILCD